MFKLEFDIDPIESKVNLSDKVLMMGSCFSDSIGQKFRENKFDCEVNPFGTVYNPYSIFKILSESITGLYDLSNCVPFQGIYHYWDAHSKLSSSSVESLETKVNEAYQRVYDYIEKSKWIIITPGTSFVYTYIPSQQIVANCHKIPNHEFEKSLLQPGQIVDQFTKLNALIYEVNPDIRFVFTVSPVRHVRDGLIQNNRSKGILHQAIHEIISTFNNCHYFPSYEIIIDELRDYRFYDKDMVHPNQLATDYIWDRFSKTIMDEETMGFLQQWKVITRALAHQPHHRESEAHQNFLRETVVKLSKLQDKVDVKKELTLLEKQIIN